LKFRWPSGAWEIGAGDGDEVELDGGMDWAGKGREGDQFGKGRKNLELGEQRRAIMVGGLLLVRKEPHRSIAVSTHQTAARPS